MKLTRRLFGAAAIAFVATTGVSHAADMKIAIINMKDDNEYAMKYFFQGSTGGQTTFSMLGATFIQPHLEKPLLEGLILLYNGEALPELDHINLSGILIPRLVKYVARRAIYHSKMENIRWNHDRQRSQKLES